METQAGAPPRTSDYLNAPAARAVVVRVEPCAHEWHSTTGNAGCVSIDSPMECPDCRQRFGTADGDRACAPVPAGSMSCWSGIAAFGAALAGMLRYDGRD